MDPNIPTDAELVAAALGGEREAFGQLYDRYARLVRAVVVAVSNDWSGAEDIVQETFMRAYRNLAKLREPANFREWIVGISRKVANERRRLLRRDRHEFRDPGQWDTTSTTDGETAAGHRDEIALVMRTLAELPEQERLAIHAFFLDEQDVRHGAELCGLSRSGFYALVQRAVARLAARLRPHNSERAGKSIDVLK